MTSLDHRPKDPTKFVFDDTVADVFDDMALRSIPGYAYAFDRVTDIVAEADLPDYSEVWDFGTSTGMGLKAVQRGARNPYLFYRACDISESMCDKARAAMPWATVFPHDLRDGLPEIQKGKASVMIFGWTLQFVTPSVEERAAMIRQAYDALCPGGFLFVMEKYSLSHFPALDRVAQRSYIRWRRDNGYRLEEIKAKTEALAGSMWPANPEDTMQAVLSAGFKKKSADWLFRLYNFGGVVAQK